MTSRMAGKILSFLIFVTAQQLYAGGNTLQLDTSDNSIYYSVKWSAQQFPIVWRLSSDGYPGSGIDNVQLTTELEAAFNTWSAFGSGTINFTNGGTVNENTVGIDGINLLTFTDQDYLFPTGVAAFAVNYTFSVETTITDTFNDIDGDGNRDLPNGVYPPGTIYEADIVFNGSVGFEATGNFGSSDIQSVALHEIGHVLGLSHSLITDTVMYPFLSKDIASARSLKIDDIAYLYNTYSNSPLAYARSSISGTVTNGYTGEPVVGAHVFVTDPSTGDKIVGAYSLLNGEYLIPGVRKGYVGIEPLDGNPPANDPARINEVIKNTFDIDFITEFYDTNELNVESSPLNAKLIDLEIAPGFDAYAPVTNINIITNTSAPPGIGIILTAGLNVFSYPVQTQDGFSAFDLLQAIGDDAVINSIDKYNPDNGRYERVFWQNGLPAGVNFSIKRGEAYLVHMQVNKNVTFEGVQDCPLVKTKAGFNLIGVPCPPPGYSAFDLLTTLGGSAVSVKSYDPVTAGYKVALAVVNDVSTGDDFSIDNGVGYIVEMLADQGEVALDGGNQNFPAYISGISPGRAVTGSRVSITGMGFSEEVIANEVLFNGARAVVNTANVNTLAVTIPNTATTGPVTVGSRGATSNDINFIVEPRIVTEADVVGKDLIDGQTVQGNLSNNAEQDRYSFVATKDTYVTATAVSVNPSVPDLILFLEGPSGEILATDNNSAGGSNPKINRFKLNRTGRYTVVVTSVPNTGTGPYSFSLNLENVPPVNDINILTGDAQNGLMGTQLKEPLELYVTGPDGLAMAGVPVTLTTDSDSVIVSDAFAAASYSYTTNANGVVAVNIALPNAAGEYKIDIFIPGYPVKTITASSLPALPVTVQVSGNDQTCNSTGCTVGQVVANPYQLKFLDNSGLPVSGVITKFEVVSGEGELLEGTDTNKQSVKLTSDVNGIVKVTHKLGNILFDAKGNKKSQIVAAISNIEGSEIELFEPVVKAAAPVKVESIKTNTLRMTMGTGIHNAINIHVKDQYDNPVPNIPITFAPVGGLNLVEGSIDGVKLPSLSTNANGDFVGTLQAPFNGAPVNFFDAINQTQLAGTIRLGVSGVAPTIDEFGARIKDPYKFLISAEGVTAPLQINVDIDMGPNLILVPQSGGLDIDDKQWVGRDFDKPVVMKVMSYQRTDRCSNLTNTAGTVTDDDNGDWTDEPFTLNGIRSWSYFDINATYTVIRKDGIKDLTIQLTPTISSQPPSDSIKVSTEINLVDGTVFKNTNIEPVKVSSGNASGQIKVNAVTDPYPRVFDADTVCLFNSGDPSFGTISYPNGVDIGIQRPPLTNDIVPPMANFLPLSVSSPTLTITVSDDAVTEPDPDPYPSLRSATGVDLSSVIVTLNGAEIFNGVTSVAILNTYPNYIELKSDGAPITTLEDSILNLLAPMNFEIIYQPMASELNITGTNAVVVIQAKDKIGNSIPTPIIYEFTAP